MTDEQADVIDIEQYAKDGKDVPPGKRYRIRIDRKTYVIDKANPTGSELLTLAGRTPVEAWRLDQILRGGASKQIGPNDTVDLTAKGVERFVTTPRQVQEGAK